MLNRIRISLSSHYHRKKSITITQRYWVLPQHTYRPILMVHHTLQTSYIEWGCPDFPTDECGTLLRVYIRGCLNNTVIFF